MSPTTACLLLFRNTGYTPPQNLTHYAQYLDYRIRAYKDLKHDPIRVQAENNRDMRAEKLEDETRRTSLGSGSVGFGNASNSGGGSMTNRRLTIAGRKLRIMSVEKGLLRETKIVQKMIDTLLECKVSPFCERLAFVLTVFTLSSSTWMTWRMS